jgi:hypothetical protein
VRETKYASSAASSILLSRIDMLCVRMALAWKASQTGEWGEPMLAESQANIDLVPPTIKMQLSSLTTVTQLRKTRCYLFQSTLAWHTHKFDSDKKIFVFSAR